MITRILLSVLLVVLTPTLLPVKIDGGPIRDFLPLSDRVIRLITREAYDKAVAQKPSNYRLVSSTDAAFVQAKHPRRVGLHHFVTAFKGDWKPTLPVVRYELFLLFEQKMKNGQTYQLFIDTLKTASGKDAGPQTLTFEFNDTDYINGSVKASQVGYLPDSPKYGYIGNYLGSAGAMEIDPQRFEIREADTHTPVFQGTPRFRAEDPLLSGEKVYDCDFSALTTPGTYYLYVPGIGRTYRFRIGVEVFEEVYYKTARAFYYQRCGMALEEQYAGPWAHAACHLNDAVIHPSHRDDRRYAALYSGEEIGREIEATRGWHDAGDYGKYVPTAANALFHLFTAYELFPEKFGDGDLNIPESGNGIPDFLDEIKWEIDWLRNMQAYDGGVYYKIVPAAGTQTWMMPELITATRYFAPKTTHSTALYAAVLAMAYRIFLPFWPDYAHDCLARAERAWAFLERFPDPVPPAGFANPSGLGGGGYSDDYDIDNRAWAAAELYKATGQQKYHDAFAVYWTEHDPLWPNPQEISSFKNHQRKASWAYATTTGYPTRSDYVNRYKKDLRTFVEEQLIRRTQDNIFRHGARLDVPQWIGWGAFAESCRYAWALIQASYLLQEPSYLDYAKINLDPQLGNNPQYQSYITGVGHDTPMDPLHIPSFSDEVADPVPGLPVFGPHYWLSQGGNPFFIDTYANLYPAIDDYPVLRRYWDSRKLVPMSEFTIEEMAHTAAVFAFFRPFERPSDDTPPTRPQNLRAVTRSASQIDLSWQAASDSESAIRGYKIYRQGVFIGISGNPSFSDHRLREATPYTYAVSAVNDAGLESARSTPETAVTLADVTPPRLVSVSAPGPNKVVVVYSEPVEEASATRPANYELGQNGTVNSAILAGDHKTVILTTSSLADGVHILTVQRVQDRASRPNALDPGSHKSFSYFSPGHGLFATYYNGMDFRGKTVTRVDPTIDFNWGGGSPHPAIGVDRFSVRWSGQLLAEQEALYTFYAQTDDGVRLWIDGRLLIDRWMPQAQTEWSGTIGLSTGKHAIRMEYYEKAGGAIARLMWSSPSLPKQVIPQRYLYPEAKP